MSISSEIMDAHKGVVIVFTVTKSDLHGEDAVEVIAYLLDGRTITGKFAKHPRSSFGGVQFENHKDVAGLMISKIDSVLRGTNEVSN